MGQPFLVHIYTGSTITRYEETIKASHENLLKIEEMYEVLATLREKIAEANAKTNINSLLMRAATHRKMARDLKVLKDRFRASSGIPSKDARIYFTTAEKAGEMKEAFIYDKDSLTNQKLAGLVIQCERKLNRTMDEINDINVSNKITIDLPDDLYAALV